MATYINEDDYVDVNIREVEGNLLGINLKFEYNAITIAYAIVALRIVMGWILFQAGIIKVLDPEWTAANFLQFAIPNGNPFMGLWASLAGSPLIDFLVAWGLTLTGLGLILGVLVRWNAFWAAFMMILFWMAGLQGGLADFLPVENGYVVDQHIVYAFLLFGLGAFGAGRVIGVDRILENAGFVQNNRYLRLLLG